MTDTKALCLDVTRLVRRAELTHPTGIDRVEQAYLRMVLGWTGGPVFGLVRIGRRFAILDAAALRELSTHLGTGRPAIGPWRLAKRLAGLRRLSPLEATARRIALATPSASGLSGALGEWLPAGTVYLNVGHSNLETNVLTGIASVDNGRSVVLVHDTIPLDLPQYQRPGTVEAFRNKMQAVSLHADRVVVPSRAVAADVARHFAVFGRLPPVVVAPLGLGLDPDAVRQECPPEVADRPYFVCLGTIEPRKNHALLLDLWTDLHRTLPEDEVPRLVIVGRRGWRNEEVFRRLDTLPFMGRTVLERGDLADGPLVALLAGARGLLHPSLAEGFGLPPQEAAALGVTPVCAPLPVYRETLGDAAVYADPGDLYQWRNAVLRLAKIDGAGQGTPGTGRDRYDPPTWESHFKLALTTIC
ncbi:glycosyltransferase family 4 protein [Palleronia sp. KMU-117]|uniref:glycosyltransferase family 4 protein n=1 Tax=Palleronia sp. KMU-117 TaxID=3434108 RepID=UPI003D7654F9